MIHECFRANTGIQFSSKSLKRLGLNPDALLDLCPTPATAQVAQVEAVAHAAEPSDRTLVDPIEEYEELGDVRSKKHCELKRQKLWWIVEYLPVRFREQHLKENHYKWKHFRGYVFVSSTINDSFTRVWLYCRMNRGLPRRLPKSVRDKEDEILVHRSVRTKIDTDPTYQPKVNFYYYRYKLVPY